MERFLKSGVGNGKSSILGSPKNGGGGPFILEKNTGLILRLLFHK